VLVTFCVGLAIIVVGSAPAHADDDELMTIEVGDTLDAEIDFVRLTLLDLEAFKRWFPALGDWRVLSRSESTALVYGSQALPWPISDRDYVVRYRWWTGGDGDFHLEARALADASPGPQPGRVRIERMRTEWRLTAEDGRTRVLYVYEGSPGIPLPDWVMRIGWESQTGRLIDALASEVGRRVMSGP
jgi:hypothetical protein